MDPGGHAVTGAALKRPMLTRYSWRQLRRTGAAALALALASVEAGATPCTPPPIDLPDASGPEYWSSQEKWVWAMTQVGEIADFNARYGECEALDPKQDDRRWNDPNKPRLLTERFLLDIFSRSEFVAALPPRGLRVVGARFASGLDLAGIDLTRQVWLESSRFEGPLRLVGASFERTLSFVGSVFRGSFNLRNVRIGQDLLLNDATFKSRALLVGAQAEGSLFADRSNFQAELNLERLNLGQLLLLRDATFEGNVRLYGAEIAGALEVDRSTFQAGLNMEGLELGGALLLRDATLMGDARLYHARIRALESDRSTFHAGLDMEGLEAEKTLSMQSATFKGNVTLLGAQIGGPILADHSAFQAELNMARLDLRLPLMLRNGTFGSEVRLYDAGVGALVAYGSTFLGGTDMRGLKVEHAIDLRDATFAGNLSLDGAQISGDLDVEDSTFQADVSMTSAVIRKSLWLGRADFSGNVVLYGAAIGGDVDMRYATFAGLVDATGTAIAGELSLGSSPGSSTGRPPWRKDAGLVLRNAHVGAIQDLPDSDSMDSHLNAWPARGKLELDGFSYERLGGWVAPSASADDSGMIRRPSSWYIDWLARDTSYTPHPYQQLATLFREVGANGKANDILYAGRERERSETSGLGWLGLSLLKWTIGYGIGFGYFLVLWWVIGLTLVGAIILWTNQTTVKKTKRFDWCVWASFDWMLPLIELDRAHTDFICNQPRWRLNWFYFQAITGYVLAAFIGAGVAGLTQGV